MAISAGTVVADAKMNMRGFMRDLKVMRKSGSKAAERVSKKWKRVGGQFQRVGGMLTAGVTAPLVGAGALALKTAADYESLRQSMDILNKSAEEGARNFRRLKEFAARTPFRLKDLANAQNMLQGFGLEADEAFDSIKNIGDIAAVASGNIKGIAMAFGQSAAEGRLMTRDIKQLINQGVPATKLLADTMGVAQDQIFDLASQGKISFEILQQAMSDATSKGGMFADGMKKQAETLGGVWSTFRDNVDAAMAEVGQSFAEAFDIKAIAKSMISSLQSFTEWFGNLSEGAKTLTFGVTGVVAALGPLSFAIGTLIKSLPLLTAGFSALNKTLLSNPIYAVGAAIAFVGTKAFIAHKELQKLKESVSGVIEQGNDLDAVNKKIAEIGELFKEAARVAKTIPGMTAEDVIDPEIAKQLERLIDLQRKLSQQDLIKKGAEQRVERLQLMFALMSDKMMGVSNTANTMDISRPFVEAKQPVHDIVKGLGLAQQKMQKLTDQDLMRMWKEGVDLGEKIAPPGSMAAAQERLQKLREQLRFATDPEVINRLQTQIRGLEGDLGRSSGAAQQLGQSIGQAFSQAALHGKNLMGVVRNLVKQLASRVFVQGITALITGGSSLVAGSIGSAIFGGLFHSGGMVPGSGERMIRAQGGEMVLTQSQQRALGGMMGGGQGATISERSMQKAFEKALSKTVTEAAPSRIFELSQQGRRSY